jgi:hypothetical protein
VILATPILQLLLSLSFSNRYWLPPIANIFYAAFKFFAISQKRFTTFEIMRVPTAVAILILAAGVAQSVALPLPGSTYASLFCCARKVQVLPFFADLGTRPAPPQ